MLITDLEQNDKALEDYKKRLDEARKEFPEHNFDEIDLDSIYDLLIPFKDISTNEKISLFVKEEIDITKVDNIFATSLNWDFKFRELTYYEFKNNIDYDYGVCDNITQLMDYVERTTDKDKEYICTVTPIFKHNQSSDGGWRWHKWGEYIGVQDPQHEYLYDEEDIEAVWVFTIREVVI